MENGKVTSIKSGGVKTRVDLRVEELERRGVELTKQLLHLETKLANAFATLQELVSAGNNTTLVVSCVERFLDETHGEDWDKGVRRIAEARMNLLKRRKQLMLECATSKSKLGISERNELARKLWGISRELDVRAEDMAQVIALHLQNGDVESAIDVVEETRRDRVVPTNEVAEIVDQLLLRCVEVAEKAGNEILVQRVREIAQIEAS